MLVKLEQDLARGFAPWREMVLNNQDRLKQHGMRMIFAGTAANDDSKLTVIIEFDGPEAMAAFRDDADLSKQRADAGALLETTVMTPMTADSLQNLPE